MAIFFGISGGLTAIGPIAGGFLTQWTWRSIFWINIPVALIALFLIWRSKPDDTRAPDQARLPRHGAHHGGDDAARPRVPAVGSVGLEQRRTWACIVVGAALGVWFVFFELRIPFPLLRLQIFRDRGFSTETLVLGLMSVVFVPFFFFASVYAQVSLGKSSSQAGLYLLYFFLGFVILAQVGGRILDARGAKPAVVAGCAISAVGFFLLAGKLTDLSLNAQWLYVALAGGGVGLMLGTASTDAVNRAPSSSYSEVTGITQTARNFGASLGLAVLGAILVSQNQSNVVNGLTKNGVPSAQAHSVANSLGAHISGGVAGGGPPGAGPVTRAAVHSVQVAYAQSTQTVFYIMAGVMAATFLVALIRLPPGRVDTQEITETPAEAASA